RLKIERSQQSLNRAAGGGGRALRRGRRLRRRRRVMRLPFGDAIKELHRGNLQAVDQRGGFRFEKHVRQQQRDGNAQARRRVVHGDRNGGGQQAGLFRRIRRRHRAEGADEAGDGAEQADEQADVGERRQVVGAFFDARNDFE